MKVQITELTKNELSDIIGSVISGNGYFYFDKEKYSNLISEDEKYYEDKIASVLANGGEVVYVDEMAEEDDTIYGNFNVKAELNDDGEMEYTINLKTFLAGLNNSTESIKYLHEMLIEESGDAYTAWCIVQLGVFGELIYG